MSVATTCDCTARCGDDPWLRDGRAVPCSRQVQWRETELRDAVAGVMLTEMGLPDVLAALQELKAHRAAKGNAA